MSSGKNLGDLAIKSIQKIARSTHRFSVILNHNFETPRFLSSSSNLPLQPRVFRSCTDHFPENFTDSTRKFYSELEIRCWKCGAPLPFLACASCKSVQPVDPSVDYFQIFGLEKGYKIRDDNLEGKYKDWQKKLHPDLVHTKSEKERSYAAEQSARVIDAYRTLSKPLSRAMYLLQLEGIHVDEEKTVSDPELLAEIMEIREAVEEANGSQALKEIQCQRMTYYQRAIEEIIRKS
eukprot:TRINITY_DN1749_c0_g1_i2.p1 TRINITY_DN1749_c0_g1~~TRINITY_DN1749_c0_g1_i2.p1  ORF type:complete len:235 (+),score=27.06 TRINITY_DN1749_c0_g1_i2:39-743(+)